MYQNAGEYISLISSLPACRCATTTNVSLSALSTADGVSYNAGERILVRAQTNPLENGIWIAQSGLWNRSYDMQFDVLLPNGLMVYVREGTTLGDRIHVMRATAIPGSTVIRVGTDALTFKSVAVT